MWAYSVSQPVLSMLDANPEFVVVRGSTKGEIVAFAVALVVVVPAVALLAEWLVSLASRRAGDILHVAFLGLFVVPLALLVAKQFDPVPLLAVTAAVAAAAGLVAAYLRWRHLRTFLTFSVVLPAIGLALFVADVPAVVDDAQGYRLEVPKSAPVVLVVFDELPTSSLMNAAGKIDPVRYPSFARLAADATWYRGATTVHDHSTGAVPAILTGELPEKGDLPSLASHPRNLFTVLGESYRMDVHESLTWLCPQRYCPRDRKPAIERAEELVSDVEVAFLHRILPESLAGGLPSIDDRFSGLARERILASNDFRVQWVFDDVRNAADRKYQDFLNGLTANESPRTLHFVHVALPHKPWRVLPSGREYLAPQSTDGIDGAERWGSNPWLVKQGMQRHLLQVGYADRLLGRLLDRLERHGLYDRALVAVVADHGIGFVPGESARWASRENLGAVARVPLLIKVPGQQEGRVDPRAAQTIDVVPTIADVLDVRLPWAPDGRSLVGLAPDDARVEVRNHDGGAITAPAEVVERQLGAALQTKLAIFGDGRDSLYRIGTNVDLLGAPATRLGSPVRVRLDNPAQFRHVRASSAFVPARISGTVESELPRGVELAVVVNGKVAALTRAFRADGALRFAALVPEEAFREGANDVRVAVATPARRAGGSR
jgi:hypothetical protein